MYYLCSYLVILTYSPGQQQSAAGKWPSFIVHVSPHGAVARASALAYWWPLFSLYTHIYVYILIPMFLIACGFFLFFFFFLSFFFFLLPLVSMLSFLHIASKLRAMARDFILYYLPASDVIFIDIKNGKPVDGVRGCVKRWTPIRRHTCEPARLPTTVTIIIFHINVQTWSYIFFQSDSRASPIGNLPDYR